MEITTNAPSVEEIERELHALGEPEVARALGRFFKTGPGEYGEGDRFLGIRVPVLRRLARLYGALELPACRELLGSPFHEARLLALLILVRHYDRGDEAMREAVYRLYLDHLRCVNNWDLVDSSAEHIIGRHLRERDKTLLDDLARSSSIWDRRIAIMATFHYVKAGSFDETLRIGDLLLDDPHDLVQKAVGWMIREVGKRDRATAEAFLRPRYRRMPRTMLRYAIEKFPEGLRQQYLRGEIE